MHTSSHTDQVRANQPELTSTSTFITVLYLLCLHGLAKKQTLHQRNYCDVTAKSIWTNTEKNFKQIVDKPVLESYVFDISYFEK